MTPRTDRPEHIPSRLVEAVARSLERKVEHRATPGTADDNVTLATL